MSTLTREMRGSYAFIERNWFLVKRYWGWEVAYLVYA
ncbi:MAG: ABC transporter permease, partial [Chloroflexi bacterium]|nr:ABC transporter permease [Chloroflexota bacterium]